MQEILTYSISSVILSGAFYALFRAFLQGERNFSLNRKLLLALVVASLALPALSFTGIFTVKEAPLPAPRESITRIVGRGFENSVVIERPLEIKLADENSEARKIAEQSYSKSSPKPIASQRPSESDFPYAGTALGAYATGFLALLLKFFYGILKIRRIAGRSRITRYPGFSICDVDESIAPFSFWKTIYLPLDMYSDEERNQVILHERAHIEQRHSLDLIFLELACAIGWFNPFLRLFKKSAVEIHEYLADSATLSAGISKIDYSSTLYKNLTGEKLFAPSHYLNKDQIKRRLKMMSKAANKRLSNLKYALVLPAVALLGLAFSCSQESNFEKVDSKWMRVQLAPIIIDGANNGVELHSTNNGKELKLNYPGGEKALRELILSEPAFRKIANRKDISLELMAELKLDENGKVMRPYRMAFDEYNNKGILGKYQLEEKFASVIDKFPELEIENYSESYGGRYVFFKIMLGDKKQNAYEASMKQARPDVFPKFPGSYSDMEKFINSHLKVPKIVTQKGINLKLHVYFFVEQDGSITEPIVRSYKIDDNNWNIGSLFGCDEEAKEVIRSMPKWKPAMKDGKPIRYATFLPIMFGDEDIWNAKNQNYIQFEPIKGSKVETSSNSDYSGRPEFDYRKISSFIQENVKYPKSQIPANISGVVVVSFELSNRGEFVNPKIERGINKAFDEEALRVIKSLKPVKPLRDEKGEAYGYKIKTRVDFKL